MVKAAKSKSEKSKTPSPGAGALTEEERIAVLKAGGLSDDEIAIAAGYSVEKLREKFSEVLTTARPRVRAKIIELVYASAMKGSPAAQKFFLSETDLLPPAKSPNAAGEKKDEPPARVPRLGKKAAAALAAQSAEKGTDWDKLVQ